MGLNGDDTGDVDRLLRELIPEERAPDDVADGQSPDGDESTVVLSSKTFEAPDQTTSPTSKADTSPAEPVTAPGEPESDLNIADTELAAAAPSTPAAPSPIDGQEPSRSRAGWVLPALLAGAVLMVAVGYVAAGRDIGGSSDLAGDAAGDVEPAGPASSTTVDTTGTAGSEPTSQAAPTGSTAALQERLASLATPGVWFVEGSEQLTDDGRGAITELAVLLAGEPAVPLVVDVATFDGTSPANLGAQQAETIVAALVAEGIDPLLLTASGPSLGRPSASADVLAFETDADALASELGAAALTVDALADDDGLSAVAIANLDALGVALANNPSASVLLAGHVDAGSAEASHDRSHLIVDQAKAYLEGIGVDATRVRLVGRSQAPVQFATGSTVELLVGPSAAIAIANNRFAEAPDLFAAGTTDLTPEGQTLIADIAATLVANPPSSVEVVAYAYSEASDAGNHDLSHDQGQAVADLLAEAGLSQTQLSVVGMGDDAAAAEPGRTNYVALRAEV